MKEVQAALAEHALLEYASGQPRDKKGRFGSTGSSGGGGGGAAEYSDPTLFQTPKIGIVSTDPSTVGQIQTLNLGVLPAKTTSAISTIKATEPKGTLSMHTTAEGKLTGERELLHTQLVSRQVMSPSLVSERGVARDDGKPTLVIMGGGGGSGKTTVLKKLEDRSDPEGIAMRRAIEDAGVRIPSPALKPNDDGTTTLRPTGTASIINSDHAKHGIWGADREARADRMVPTTTGSKARVTAAARVHEESAVVAQRSLEVSIHRGGDIIFDGTGDGTQAKREGIYRAASSTHEVVGVFITTRIGTSPTDGIRGTVALRNKKAIEVKTTDSTGSAKIKRNVPDAVVTDGHIKANAAIIQGVSGSTRSWDRAVIIERVPDIDIKTGTQRTFTSSDGQPPQPKFTYVVAATYNARDGFVETAAGRGVRSRIEIRGRVDSEGKPRELTNAEKIVSFNEAVDPESTGIPPAPVEYEDLIAMWVEVLCGCEKEKSDVLKRNPQASDYWDYIVVEVAAAPEDETIDIPSEPSERSAELQSVYSVGVADQVHIDMPMGDSGINLAEANMVLPAHANALYDAYETIAKRHGKWTQQGSDGANYVTVSPFAYEGRMCSTCAFWVSPNGCEIVEGLIRPQGGCKLNIRAAIKESETEEKD